MNITKTRLFFIISVLILSILISLGNFIDLGIFSSNKVSLGLDLKGGSQILLKIDYDNYLKEQLNLALRDLRTEFRKNKIKLVPQLKVNNKENGVKEYFISINVDNNTDINMKEIKKIVKKINENININDTNDTLILTFNKESIYDITNKLLQQSIETVRRRIDETGTKEPIIQAEGRDKILVQVPGMESPEELKKVLGKTAKMTFHFIDRNILDDTNLPSNIMKLYDSNNMYVYFVEKEPLLHGDLLEDASVSFQEGKPAVGFRFNKEGARKFANITRNNVGKILAIVLDNQVITAPVINGPILGGVGVITGDFSTDEASRLALLLRSGALPVPLEIIEERIVGPSLGQDSIESGLKACLIGFIFVLIFMLYLYRFFGVITNITLIVNLFVSLACLSIINATLTLPGIAGIVLSIGMAVDTNVLIFERIKEEYKTTGKLYQSIASGFDLSWSGIFDSNITTLLVAIILYTLGTGAVKGFALVLCIGIFTSLFTGVLLTKLLLNIWLNYFKPTKINI